MPAVILGPILWNKYKNKYIYDYRDYTYEKYLFFAKRIEKIANNSFLTCFSSKGYLNYFSKIDNYYISHNISNEERKVELVEDLKKKKKICIGFLGYVRYFDLNTRLIDAFANNSNYFLMYAGSAFTDCDLPLYCKNNNVNNVEFYGSYENNQKPILYKSIDIINSVYSLGSPEVREAIPNRVYDAALFKKPIMVAQGTYLAQIVEQYGLGLQVDPFGDDVLSTVETYIHNFNPEVFKNNCESFLQDVRKDQERLREAVQVFIRS